MANAGNSGSASERISNWVAVLDDRLRTAVKPQAGGAGGPFGAVAVPAALLGGLFAATLVGAASYRRSAKQLARALPPSPAAASKAPPGVAGGIPAAADGHGPPPKAGEVLTKGELFHLFVVPGIFSAALAASLGGICRWALDVDSVDDAVRQVRWLLGTGARPSRVVSSAQPPAGSPGSCSE
eukprot:TRINITY_DN55486_c0_g1_i1.p1 TRINITY_DN55486_c0_g1~~TRINITY_DN55486_c0_g1_i1.p1  ORF type:complete len:215 (+),score=26.42 TRINITY_DN55486_c0_g1_i1:98-646(+)